MRNLPSRDPFDNFDKTFNRMAGAMIVVWVTAAILSLVVVGVVIWAVIQIVPAIVAALA